MVNGITGKSSEYFTYSSYFFQISKKYFIPTQKEYIHLFNKYLLREYYLPARDLHAWDTTGNYLDKIPTFMESMF